jgi:multidrug efflux pump
MIAASFLGIFVIPILYVVFQDLRERIKRGGHAGRAAEGLRQPIPTVTK